LIVLGWLSAVISTRSHGLFIQKRVGRNGSFFSVVKLRTMRRQSGVTTTVTTSSDTRITRIGAILRKTKIDELPQLWNVLIGQMSFVGPRPDVPGFADRLTGEARSILLVKPGITGVASLFFRDEEDLLAQAEDPERYNQDVIWPKKVELNLAYLRDYSFRGDLVLIVQTIFPKRKP
jgi:lipopolysaccharide/colanic/teichoic acid biosynthesis glycosyltransferase